MSKGWEKTLKFLDSFSKLDRFDEIYDETGKLGVEALRADTPKRTGKTSNSWTYKVTRKGKNVTLEWHNTNVNDEYNVARLLQEGHGTGYGGYVHGKDYINPAMLPVFNFMTNSIWEEVTK